MCRKATWQPPIQGSVQQQCRQQPCTGSDPDRKGWSTKAARPMRGQRREDGPFKIAHDCSARTLKVAAVEEEMCQGSSASSSEETGTDPVFVGKRHMLKRASCLGSACRVAMHTSLPKGARTGQRAFPQKKILRRTLLPPISAGLVFCQAGWFRVLSTRSGNNSKTGGAAQRGSRNSECE